MNTMNSTVVMKSDCLVVLSFVLALLIVAGTTVSASAKGTQITKKDATVNSVNVATLVSHTETTSAAKVVNPNSYCTQWGWVPGYWVPGYYYQGYWFPEQWVPGYQYCINWAP